MIKRQVVNYSYSRTFELRDKVFVIKSILELAVKSRSRHWSRSVDQQRLAACLGIEGVNSAAYLAVCSDSGEDGG